MTSSPPLLVPDPAALRRKLADPPPILASLLERFRRRLDRDAEFRSQHIFLPALLGEPEGIAEAKEHIVALVGDPLRLARIQSRESKTSAQDSLDFHIWCVAPRAMRLAVYFDWLKIHDAWSLEEGESIGSALLDFFENRVLPVLRARVPAGHNQQLSMTLCSAVVGEVFSSQTSGRVGERARTLSAYALPKLRQTLGLMPSSGYSGEGSTYQSDVVSPLVMWAGIFLAQRGEPDVWQTRRGPNDVALADTLRLESGLGSCGGWLPPWDDYGWQRVHNLAARTLWASLTNNPRLLALAADVWDEDNFIAWRPDDRLWTLLYWPEHEVGNTEPLDSALGGWSLPSVGAAVEHRARKLRALLVWDRCTGNAQGVGRSQVNPNHLMIDLNGEPISADGWQDGSVRLISPAACERTLQSLPPLQQEMIARQYGSVEEWLHRVQHGLLGASSGILVDGWESYFPSQAREGKLLYEERTPQRHTIAGEAAAYYQPAFDLTRARRTVSMEESGVLWIVDDVRAATVHDFIWRLWLRMDTELSAPQAARLELPSGTGLTLAWYTESDGVMSPEPVRLDLVGGFPKPSASGHSWPDAGSARCDLAARGACVRFVTCLVPESVQGLTIEKTATHAWKATWSDGAAEFVLPREITNAADQPPVQDQQIHEMETLDDLDEIPCAISDAPDDELLAALESPPVGEWRRTGAAMQALAVRGVPAAFPKILLLLQDDTQNYTVHSVAAWCLGHVRYALAEPTLLKLASAPEINAAIRARNALERLHLAS